MWHKVVICGKIGKKSISSYDDILVDSSKNSDNIDVDESQFDNCEDESDIESENDLAAEILNDDLPGIFKKLSKNKI